MTTELRPYAIEYRLGGKTMCETIDACSYDDAVRRIRQIGVTGRVLGEHVIEMPVFPGAARWRRLWEAVKGLVAS